MHLDPPLAQLFATLGAGQIPAIDASSGAAQRRESTGGECPMGVTRAYEEYLQKEGYRPLLNDNGMVEFKHEGDVFVLGGRLEAAPGARIEGRSVSYPTVSSAWLTLMEGPSLGLSAGSPLILGAKLALMAAWLALTLLLFATSGRQLLETSDSVQANPGRNFVTGVATRPRPCATRSSARARWSSCARTRAR